ncbi:MAG TPA: glycosyltransferase family 2 protein [Candidatus Omnitrophota bacterium]|nr:glycosyltransferase family 2 protein [Candidatus Omnitrophota bacterium]
MDQKLNHQGPIVLSIIVVNYETPDYTLQCLRSIEENKPACAYEVIVIDNGSSDGSLEMIRSGMPSAICIETGANLGFARANNLGISNARGEFILLLNSDTKVLDSCLDRMVEYLIQNPKVGVVGPRQLDGAGKLQLSWGAFPTFFTEIYRKLVHQKLSMNDLKIRDYLEEKYSGQSDVDWVSGSCLLARRGALMDSGLLDGHFFMYFEDIDLCRQVQKKGWRIQYLSDWTILHFGGVSAKKNLLHVLVEYRRSQLYFTRKHYGLKGVLLLKTLLFSKSIVNLARWGFVYWKELLMKRDVSESFAKLLLSKKSLELIFS